ALGPNDWAEGDPICDCRSLPPAREANRIVANERGNVRAFLAVLITLGASLALAGSVVARPNVGERRQTHTLAAVNLPWSGLSVGVNDDAGKTDSLRDWFYPAMSADGLSVNTLTIQWDENDPFTIPAQGAVTSAIENANANGISIELDLYPLHSQA